MSQVLLYCIFGGGPSGRSGLPPPHPLQPPWGPFSPLFAGPLFPTFFVLSFYFYYAEGFIILPTCIPYKHLVCFHINFFHMPIYSICSPYIYMLDASGLFPYLCIPHAYIGYLHACHKNIWSVSLYIFYMPIYSTCLPYIYMLQLMRGGGDWGGDPPINNILPN